MKLLSSFLCFTMLTSFNVSAINSLPQYESDKDSIAKKSKGFEKTFYDTSAIFKNDWNNNQTFCYTNKKYDVTKGIELVDSIHSYAFPIENKTTSPFGRRHSSFHKGIDIPLKNGEAIVAAFDGKVRYAKYNNGGFGNLVIIRHVNGLETYYAHLSKFKVKPNQIVKAGQVIGLGGSTGRSYSPHLHFEVRYKDKAINPERIFNTEEYCLRNDKTIVGELVQNMQQQIKHSHLDESFLAEGKVYSIQKGDTLSKIAARSGTTVSELCALNGLSQQSVLQIGQKIRIN